MGGTIPGSGSFTRDIHIIINHKGSADALAAHLLDGFFNGLLLLNGLLDGS
jgi:hypothetical protein